MKKQLVFPVILLVVIIWRCASETAGTAEVRKEYPASFQLLVENTGAVERTDEVIFLNIAGLKARHPDFNAAAFVVFHRNVELPAQSIDADGDGSPDCIALLTDLAAHQQQPLTVFYAPNGTKIRNYPRRTQAEISRKVGGYFENRKYIGGRFQNVRVLRVPPEHTDHSFFIRYEGPGWESDKIGYRYYLDWRNAIDIFGKKTPEMVLQKVGLDGFDSYHEMRDWGMDILKVGESLGIGAIGMWHQGKAHRVAVTDSIRCEIVASGPVYSRLRTVYSGWQVAGGKYDLVSDLSITAGSRLTRHELQISGTPPNLCTGIVTHPEARRFTKTAPDGGWGYLATCGPQSLVNDRLGMAVLFRQKDLVSFESDDYSEVVVLQPENGKLQYYFLAAWQQEPGGIQSEPEFMAYLEAVVAKLNHPVMVKF